MTAPVLDVVIPVFNEQATLAACVRRLHAHLVDTFPYPFRITIADNASTDGTWGEAVTIAALLPGVTAVHLDQKGRGRALKHVWLASESPILAYMDVDLSTDLDALWPLVAPLMSGHSDVAIGTRLHRSSRVVRGAKRELVSRCYNLVLRGALRARFSDAQCGFKAIRRDVAQELLPMVEDTGWFFDTELLVLAERSSLRIHEVPVDWFDDPDSRVDIVATATDDLRGVWRLGRALWRRALPVDRVATQMGRGLRGGVLAHQVTRFAGVGILSTVAHLGLFALFASFLASAQVANALALLLATVFNTWGNRRWTFGVHGSRRALRHQLQALFVFGLTWAMSAGGLALLHTVAAAPSTWVETSVIALANAISTVVRFVAMRSWIFAGAGDDPMMATTSARVDRSTATGAPAVRSTRLRRAVPDAWRSGPDHGGTAGRGDLHDTGISA